MASSGSYKGYRTSVFGGHMINWEPTKTLGGKNGK